MKEYLLLLLFSLLTSFFKTGCFQIVIIGEIKSIQKLRKENASVTARTNHILILNLALADLLMGIYLVVFGILEAVHDYFRLFNNNNSILCQIIGPLAVVSNETSVITMTYFAGFRLFAIYKVSETISLTYYAYSYIYKT